MAERFFVETPIQSELARLTGSEAHHALHVMRLGVGAEITLFDGSGAEFVGQVTRAGRADVDLHVISRTVIDRELPLALHLAVALPKGDRQRWLVEKAVELGVTRLCPLRTQRSNDRESAAALQRLQRAVIEASKQCGRNRLMEVAEPRDFAEIVALAPTAATRWLAHPGGTPVRAALAQDADQPLAEEVWIAVGPEGGFSDAEQALATSQGWRSIGLGARILRVETAALLLAGLVAANAE